MSHHPAQRAAWLIRSPASKVLYALDLARGAALTPLGALAEHLAGEHEGLGQPSQRRMVSKSITID